jgi:3-oxoadipate enol-lactonase
MSPIKVGDIELNVIEQGKGTPLLLVHGFPLDHSMWRPQIDAFKDRYRVIAPDLRGFGKSSATSGTVTMEQYADDLAGLLVALKIQEPAVFCGLSMGGYIAWQFWRKHADQLRALVLCDTRAVADSEEAARGRHKTAEQVISSGTQAVADTMLPKLLAESTRRDKPEVVEATRSVILSAPREGVAAALRGMASRPDVTNQLPQIKVPTLVICGEHDAISPVDEMRKIATSIKGSTFEVIHQSGHMPPLENPSDFNSALDRFLQSLSAD